VTHAHQLANADSSSARTDAAAEPFADA